MRRTLWIALASMLLTLSMPATVWAAVANSLILNEANTVSGGAFLEDDHVDSVLGRLEGNGQNWLEFLVVQGDDLGGGSFANTLDLRGWVFEWEYNKDGLGVQYGNGTVTFSDDPLWAAVPQGTLIAINEWQQAWYLTDTPAGYDPFEGAGGLQREGGINGLGHQRGEPYDPEIHTLRDLSTDTSWNPAESDWSINVYAGERNPDTSFKYFTFTGTVTEPDGNDEGSDPDVYTIGQDDDAGLFAVNNDDWRITIKDDANNSIEGPIGEHIGPIGGINSSEILKIEDFPVGSNPTLANYLATGLGSYNDGASSTFGEANNWSSGGFTQDVSPLRSWWDENLTQTGDLNGDLQVDEDDVGPFVLALVNRPMYDAQYELPFWFVQLAGDVNGDGTFDFGDIGAFSDLIGESTSAGAEGVPEPTALALTIFSLCVVFLPARQSCCKM